MLRDFDKFYNFKYKLNDNGVNYLLYNINQVRNACAHSNCILNNLNATKSSSKSTPHRKIMTFLGRASVGKLMKDSKMSNEVIYQIVTVFYIYDVVVTSKSLKKARYNELSTLVNDTMIRKSK